MKIRSLVVSSLLVLGPLGLAACGDSSSDTTVAEETVAETVAETDAVETTVVEETEAVAEETTSDETTSSDEIVYDTEAAVAETTMPGTIRLIGTLVSLSATTGPCTVTVDVDGTEETMEYPDCSGFEGNIGGPATFETTPDGGHSFAAGLLQPDGSYKN